MSEMNVARIRVVIFQEGSMWVAQCLEYDIGAQAVSVDKLHERLTVALEAERQESLARNGEPFAGIAPAPEYFHRLWEKRLGRFEPEGPVEPNIEFALCA